jgi:uncharacterized repeat protein (TIGR03803 family)
MATLNAWKMAGAVLLLCAGAAIAAPAQTFKTLAHFDRMNGAYPRGSLVQGVNGNLYGTTEHGGANGSQGGTIFEVTPGGKLTSLYSFCPQAPNCTDGELPQSGLVEATNGNFYGTTLYGGANDNGTYCLAGCGTVFEITPTGKLTTLYSFCSQPNCTDGVEPYAGLLQATNGNFYGTTQSGGANNASSCTTNITSGCGTVFEITPAGKLTTLYSFCSQPNCADGWEPLAGLVQATNGNLYGTTNRGGIGLEGNTVGTVFEITTAGQLTTLYTFCSQPNCTDGEYPSMSLVQATNGNFYGTTDGGGANGGGTVFEITSAGQLTTLYNFCSQSPCPDGGGPNGLVEASDGNFYGTTVNGGANGGGTIFELTPAGQLTTLYSFCCTDGVDPNGLVQATNGNFYGTTVSKYGQGTVFSLSVGLVPFVETLPGAGTAGAEVGILGNKLSGATSVTFNGTPAQFKVKSPTLILTHVPDGATSGYVTVITPSGTLTSNVPFHVIP